MPGGDHCLGALQPPLADIAMRRHAHGGGECAGEVEDAETREIGKVGDRDVFSEMLFDVCENAPQPSVIQPMSRRYRRPAELSLQVGVRQACREEQRRRFHEHAARGGRRRHLRQHREADLVDEFILNAAGMMDETSRCWRQMRPSGAQRCWSVRIGVRPRRLPRYGPHRTCARSGSTKWNPSLVVQTASFRRLCR